MLVLPLCGMVSFGYDIPEGIFGVPRTESVAQPGFNPFVFGLMSLGIIAAILPFVLRVIRWGVAVVSSRSAEPFPLWGWVGVVWMCVFWVIAWTRFPVFEWIQSYTFTPLWLGYILTVNALCYMRVGRCMVTHRRRELCCLFLVSAGFWWFFEYLNRYVNNWYYEGVPHPSDLHYIVSATLSFSTVLPAVAGTYEWLWTFPRLYQGLNRWRRWRLRNPKAFGGLLVLVGGVTLFLLGIYPHWLYPLLWLSPLFILVGGQLLTGRCLLFAALNRGDWRRSYLLSLSGLLCGFFWELWNWLSVARWCYSVPHVQVLHIFEMPLLGYAGYLPFGVECGVVIMVVLGRGSSLALMRSEEASHSH